MIILGNIFMLIGAFFFALGGLGLFRMPDLFNRAQAGTKATTLGAFSMLIGVGFTNIMWMPKILIIIIFIAITNPMGSSVLGRAGYLKNVKKYEGTNIDELKELYEKDGEINE